METLHKGIDTEYFILLMIIIAVSLIICAFELAIFRPFREERRYYKLEILRTDGEERAFWEKELKYFYIRSLPFFGRQIYRKLKKNKRLRR